MAEDSLVDGVLGGEILRFHRKSAPPVPVLDRLATGLLVGCTDIDRIHRKHFAAFYRMSGTLQRGPVHLHPRSLLFVGRNPRQRHQMMTTLTDHVETFRIAICSDINGRMRFLHGLREHADLWKTIMLALPFELSAAPGAYDDVEGFGKPLLGIAPIIAKNRVFRRMHATTRAEIQSPG